jgi:hypothetical protein
MVVNEIVEVFESVRLPCRLVQESPAWCDDAS